MPTEISAEGIEISDMFTRTQESSGTFRSSDERSCSKARLDFLALAPFVVGSTRQARLERDGQFQGRMATNGEIFERLCLAVLLMLSRLNGRLNLGRPETRDPHRSVGS